MPIASNQSAGEDILHTTMVRLRVTGVGNLKMKFYSLDNTREYDLGNMNLSLSPGRDLDRLCNVIEQRAFFEIKTTEINEVFRINRIIVYARPFASQYPA